MTEEEKIIQVLKQFEDGGLISKDLNKILPCLSDDIIGIGIGEQGFVASIEDVIRIFEDGVKEPDGVRYSLTYERIEVRIPAPNTAVVCAEIVVTAKSQETVIRSRFSQSLTLMKKDEGWKICCLHASAPVVTEENIEAYPLRFAEKTLKSLKEKIGEEVYAVEEQYRMAVLMDTIAFYIINFTADTYEKCQLNSDMCVYVTPGSPYEQFARENIKDYVMEEDQERYLESFSLKRVFQAFENNEQELKCEYRMMTGHGSSFIWVVTIIRLITDIVTGEKKGIMYVKNIDQRVAMQKKAEYDTMLKIFNRSTFISRVNELLEHGKGFFLMLDIDDFKLINDTFGHPYGDRVLIRMAEALQDTFPQQAVLGRLGGDEFGVFLSNVWDKEEVRDYISHLFLLMEKLMPEGDKNVTVTCSVGIARSKGVKMFKELYQDADEALYQSKNKGKNCYSFCE